MAKRVVKQNKGIRCEIKMKSEGSREKAREGGS